MLQVTGGQRLGYLTMAALLSLLIGAKTMAVLAAGPMAIERDALGYWNLSAGVLDGDLLMLGQPVAYRTPMYPWLVAGVRYLAGANALQMLVALQGILIVATALVAGRLAASISGRPAAFLGTLLTTSLGVAHVTYGRAVMTETLFTFLLMLHLQSCAGYAKHPSCWRGVGSALTLAICVLTRPIAMLLWIPDLLLIVWVARQRSPTQGGTDVNWLRQLGQVGVMGAVYVACLLPWMLRNDHLFGRPALTEFMGRNLWVVTFQDGAGADLPLPETHPARDLVRRVQSVSSAADLRMTWPVSDALVASGLNDAEADRLMLLVARQSIEQHRVQFIAQTGRRLVNFWRCAATSLPEPAENERLLLEQTSWHYALPLVPWLLEHRISRSVAGNMVMMVVLGLALASLLGNPHTRGLGLWCACTLAYFGFVTALFEIPNYRYRLVVEPLMATVVGAALALEFGRDPTRGEGHARSAGQDASNGSP